MCQSLNNRRFSCSSSSADIASVSATRWLIIVPVHLSNRQDPGLHSLWHAAFSEFIFNIGIQDIVYLLQCGSELTLSIISRRNPIYANARGYYWILPCRRMHCIPVTHSVFIQMWKQINVSFCLVCRSYMQIQTFNQIRIPDPNLI